MWPFRTQTIEEKLKKIKIIRVNGMRFKIRAINPFFDFPSDKIPTIFTDFVSARKLDPTQLDSSTLKKYQEDMYSVIKAGVVEPDLSGSGITVDDLFRDPDIGINLYRIILDHSLNKFKGLKKLFFSILTKYKSYILWQKLTGHFQTVFYSKMGKRPS